MLRIISDKLFLIRFASNSTHKFIRICTLQTYIAVTVMITAENEKRRSPWWYWFSACGKQQQYCALKDKILNSTVKP